MRLVVVFITRINTFQKLVTLNLRLYLYEFESQYCIKHLSIYLYKYDSRLCINEYIKCSKPSAHWRSVCETLGERENGYVSNSQIRYLDSARFSDLNLSIFLTLPTLPPHGLLPFSLPLMLPAFSFFFFLLLKTQINSAPTYQLVTT